jgi:hypothetical protein
MQELGHVYGEEIMARSLKRRLMNTRKQDPSNKIRTLVVAAERLH